MVARPAARPSSACLVASTSRRNAASSGRATRYVDANTRALIPPGASCTAASLTHHLRCFQ